MAANTYSDTPRQTSSDDEEEDYYDDDDDDEDYNDGRNGEEGNVVYASLTGLPTKKQDDSVEGMEHDEILDDDDSNYDDDDDENDLEEKEADAMPRAAAMAVPVPAPRASRLVVDQPQVGRQN
jgi:hypothetical protein